MSGGLRPYPLGIDHSKIFQMGNSVRQPVNKDEKSECKRAEREYEAIASNLKPDDIVIFTDGSRFEEIPANRACRRAAEQAG